MTGDAPVCVELRRDNTRLWSGVFALFVASWLSFYYFHPEVLTRIGVGHYRIEVAPERFQELWFLDTLAILAANDAVTAGADPYTRNPLDYFNRPHVYGPAWLHLRHLGLTRYHTPFVGAVLVAGFLGSVLVVLRPQCPRRALWYAAIVCTTPVLAALERGNNDLLIFALLTPLVPCLMSERPWVRWLGAPLIVLAAALKYYPASAGLLLLTSAAERRETLWRCGAVALGLGLVGWHIMSSVPTHAVVPAPAGVLTFGAPGFLRELGLHGFGVRAATIGAVLAAACLWWRSPALRDWQPAPALRREWLYFVLGAVVLSGCFWLGQNHAYRWIFAVWLAPFLWRLTRETRAPAAIVKLGYVTAGLLVVALWAEAVLVYGFSRLMPEALGPALRGIYWGMQPFTWAFFVCLLGFLITFTREGLRCIVGSWRSI